MAVTLPLVVNVSAAPPPPTGLAVTINYLGQAVVFDIANGTDLGNYTDPGGQFIQQCVLVKNAAMPDFSVQFRPDVVGGRVEVVFEFGRCRTANQAVAAMTNANPCVITTTAPHGLVTGQPIELVSMGVTNGGVSIGGIDYIVTVLSSTTFSIPVDSTTWTTFVFKTPGQNTPLVTPGNIGPYTATITQGSTVLNVTTVPLHYWRARWRWISAMRPVRTTIAALSAAHLLPAYDISQLGIPNHPKDQKLVYTPMTFPNLSRNMGSGGVPDSIGPITENQVNCLTRGPTGLIGGAGWNEGSMRAQAEASSTMSLHFRDEISHAPLRVDTPANTGLFSITGAAFVSSTDPKCMESPSLQYVYYDSGHSPSLCYVPFLLTGDPYYLEEVQFQASYDGPLSKPSFNGTGRYWAWPQRNALYAWAATPPGGGLPSWLLPQSYFDSYCVPNWLAVITPIVTNNTNPINFFWHAMNEAVNPGPGEAAGAAFPGFQDNFVTIVTNLGYYMGRAEFQSVAEFKQIAQIQLTNGTSGWKRAYCGPYHILWKPNCALADAAAFTGSVGAIAFGSGSSTNLTLTGTQGTIHPGTVSSAAILGAGIPANAFIQSQSSGPTGGDGVYITNVATTASGLVTVKSNVLDVVSIASGSFRVAQGIRGPNTPTLTSITALGTGSGGTGTYVLNKTYGSQIDFTFTGAGSGTNLTVSKIAGSITPGSAATATITGPGIPDGTFIQSQTSGTVGGNGVYVTNQATTASGACIGYSATGSFTSSPVLNASDTTCVVDQYGAEFFPLPLPFTITCGNEQISVTNISGTTWTLLRGQGGTTPAQHTSGVYVNVTFLGIAFGGATGRADSYAAAAVVNPGLLVFNPGDPTGQNTLVQQAGNEYPWYIYHGFGVGVSEGVGSQAAVDCRTWLYGQLLIGTQTGFLMAERWMSAVN